MNIPRVIEHHKITQVFHNNASGLKMASILLKSIVFHSVNLKSLDEMMFLLKQLFYGNMNNTNPLRYLLHNKTSTLYYVARNI